MMICITSLRWSDCGTLSVGAHHHEGLAVGQTAALALRGPNPPRGDLLEAQVAVVPLDEMKNVIAAVERGGAAEVVPLRVVEPEPEVPPIPPNVPTEALEKAAQAGSIEAMKELSRREVKEFLGSIIHSDGEPVPLESGEPTAKAAADVNSPERRGWNRQPVENPVRRVPRFDDGPPDAA